MKIKQENTPQQTITFREIKRSYRHCNLAKESLFVMRKPLLTAYSADNRGLLCRLIPSSQDPASVQLRQHLLTPLPAHTLINTIFGV